MTTLPIDLKTIGRYKKYKVQYYNYPVAFDIETSSFYEGDAQRATMYIWQMGFGDSGKDLLVYGRTWEEFLAFIKKVRKHFKTSLKKRLCIYVHNLAYEFQWIRTLFEWDEVFSLSQRDPLYARTTGGLEFRCSYHLSGYSLEKTADNLLTHDLHKLVGYLDYKKVRHSYTPLSDDELNYSMYDVIIVCAYIQERIVADGNILKIPYTKTGYVRRNCQIACYGLDHKATKYYRYRDLMQRLTMTSEEYILQRCAFMGGYTHGNSWDVGHVIEDVTSMDITSDYPFQIFANKFPFSKGELCYPMIEDVFKTLNTYAWILDIEIYGCESKILQDDYISYSKCLKCSGYVLNNGRVNSADYIHIVVTSIDLEIILKTYRFTGGIQIKRAYRYYLQYLPTDFINEMLNYYEAKTTLKGVNGKEEEYLNSKEQLNSFYGMMVTSPIRPTITYEHDNWGEKPVDINKGVDRYNNNPKRFMPYIVGVFVTAYARKTLWDGILAVGTDYLYADTDSIKLTNYDAHRQYFDNYNKEVISKLYKACEHHKIPFERVSPKTIKGDQKILGVWDFDGHYTRFKTLGAKRYMVEYDNGDLSLTVSGLNKKLAIPYLIETYGRDKVFDAFTDDEFKIDNMVIPKGKSGRMVSTYIDTPTQGWVTDYLGNHAKYSEATSIHLEESTYTLSLSKDYIRFLLGIKNNIF